MPDLLAIRHAESTMNAQGLWQGQTDPPLSERGRAQARELARALASDGAWILVSSDLARARETAEILARVLRAELVLDPGLREMDVGHWSARPHQEIRERWPEDYARVRAGDWQFRPGGGETRSEVRARALAALDRAQGTQVEGHRLALVTHLGVLRALVPGIDVANAGRVQLGPDDWRGIEVQADGIEVRADGIESPADGIEAPADGIEAPADGIELQANGIAPGGPL